MSAVLSVGKQEVGVWRKVRPGKHSILAGLELGAEASSTGHQSNRCCWNWLAQIIKCLVLSCVVARLIPGVGRVLTPSAKLSEHSWEQISSSVALPGATIYFVIPGDGCVL